MAQHADQHAREIDGEERQVRDPRGVRQQQVQHRRHQHDVDDADHELQLQSASSWARSPPSRRDGSAPCASRRRPGSPRPWRARCIRAAAASDSRCGRAARACSAPKTSARSKQQAEAERVRQVAEQHRRSDLHRGEPGRRIHAVADRSAAQHRLPDRVPQRKGYQRGNHRPRTADAVLDVAHHDDLVERQASAARPRCRRRRAQACSAGTAAHVVEHVGNADALERPEQHVSGEPGDEHARADAHGGLDPVSARVGHRWILEGRARRQRTISNDNDSH